MKTAAGNSQNLIPFQRGYPTHGTTAFSLVHSNQQILLHSFSAFNANSSASDIGLGITNANPTWNFYTFNGTTGTLATSTIQSGNSVNLFDTSNNHGFMVESSVPFGYLTFNVTQAQSGSPVYTYKYWNGSSFVTLNTNYTSGFSATGYVHITFNPPADWATGDNGYGANNGYTILVQSTTAGGQAVTATFGRTGYFLAYNQSVPAYSRLQVILDQHPLLLQSGQSLLPFFGTANNNNAVEAAYQFSQ